MTSGTPGGSALFVLALTDSFSQIWQGLASEGGLRCVVEKPGDGGTAMPGDVMVVSGAGSEEQLAGAIRNSGALVPLAAIGSERSHRVAVDVMRAGAKDYFVMPADIDGLRAWIRESAAPPGGARFLEAQAERYRFDGILGTGSAIARAIDRASRIIPHGAVTVLLNGETGTGKELFAKAIHYNGPRRDKPFVAVNCAAIPQHLLESELFGHERGAFTGALAAKPGLFEVADGGTLFLDEIGHMDLVLQGKLLRALEERSVRRVGGARDRRVDIRVVAASHVDLARGAAAGTFRADLFYRLNVMTIDLPPLRARGADVLTIAYHFMERTAATYQVPLPRLTPRAESHLQAHSWPGNVRELRNAIERATLLCAGTIDVDDLELAGEVVAREGSIPFPATLRTIIDAAVREMLIRCGGNKSDAARRLGISRQRLARLMQADDEGLLDDA